MDIDRVRYFRALAEAGSYVRAAALLRLSQPALSKAIKQLEAEVGMKLVEPDGRGVRLTALGREFHARATPLLEKWLELPDRLRAADAREPTRIGSFEVFTTHFLGRLVRAAPLEELELHELPPGKLEAAVEARQVDFGITYVPVPSAGVDFLEVTRVRMGVYGLPGALPRVDFSELPFVVPLPPDGGAPSKVAGMDGWPDHRFGRRIRYRVTLMESALELCRQGRCVGYFPAFVVELHNAKARPEFRLKEIPAPLPLRERLQPVFLVLPKGAAEKSVHRQVARSLRALR